MFQKSWIETQINETRVSVYVAQNRVRESRASRSKFEEHLKRLPLLDTVEILEASSVHPPYLYISSSFIQPTALDNSPQLSWMGDVLSDDKTWMVANYVVVAGSTLWIAEFVETLPTEIDSIWIHVPLGFDISGAKGVTRRWDKQGERILRLVILFEVLFALRIYAIYNKNRFVLISSLTMIIFIFMFEVWIEALEPGISTVGSPFRIFSRCKTNPKGELPLKLCPGQSSIAQIIIRDGTLYFLATLVLAAIDGILLIDPLSDVVGPFFNVFSNLLISRLMLNLQTFTTSTITTSQGAASTGQSSSLHFAQRMLGNRNIGGTLDGDFIGEEIEFE
ncbi:hypothetical protein EV368DRAFT_60784 [Lentinula lateritia]|nr:hypothetical protein EV368DRAFT_60784 [Lentinula lateritia]